MNLQQLDEWLFKGLGGIVNMLIRRVGMEYPFNKNCQRMIQHEVQRLVDVREQVGSRQAGPIAEESPFCVLDVWFIRSYEGINNWLQIRSEKGPPMDSSSIDSLQTHITRMQEIVNHERARCNQHHTDAPS